MLILLQQLIQPLLINACKLQGIPKPIFEKIFLQIKHKMYGVVMAFNGHIRLTIVIIFVKLKPLEKLDHCKPSAPIFSVFSRLIPTFYRQIEQFFCRFLQPSGVGSLELHDPRVFV
jgi:hypothetical protein